MMPSTTDVDAETDSGACMYHLGIISAALAVLSEVQELFWEKLRLWSCPYLGQSQDDVGATARAGSSTRLVARTAKSAAGRRKITGHGFRANARGPCSGYRFPPLY